MTLALHWLMLLLFWVLCITTYIIRTEKWSSHKHSAQVIRFALRLPIISCIAAKCSSGEYSLWAQDGNRLWPELLPWSECSGGCHDHANNIWLRAWHHPRPWSGVSQWGHGMGLGRDGQIQSQPQGWREERTLGFLSDLIATYIIGTGPDTSHIMILALHWLMLLLIWVLYIVTYIIVLG